MEEQLSWGGEMNDEGKWPKVINAVERNGRILEKDESFSL